MAGYLTKCTSKECAVTLHIIMHGYRFYTIPYSLHYVANIYNCYSENVLSMS